MCHGYIAASGNSIQCISDVACLLFHVNKLNVASYNAESYHVSEENCKLLMELLVFTYCFN